MDSEYPGIRRGSGYLVPFSPNEMSYPDPDELMGSQGPSLAESPYSHVDFHHGSRIYVSYGEDDIRPQPESSENEEELMDDIDDLVAQIRQDPGAENDDQGHDTDFEPLGSNETYVWAKLMRSMWLTTLQKRRQHI
jgi:hypothetical protein